MSAILPPPQLFSSGIRYSSVSLCGALARLGFPGRSFLVPLWDSVKSTVRFIIPHCLKICGLHDAPQANFVSRDWSLQGIKASKCIRFAVSTISHISSIFSIEHITQRLCIPCSSIYTTTHQFFDFEHQNCFLRKPQTTRSSHQSCRAGFRIRTII